MKLTEGQKIRLIAMAVRDLHEFKMLSPMMLTEIDKIIQGDEFSIKGRVVEHEQRRAKR